MRRASCHAPQKCVTVGTSTETHPDLNPVAGESHPCYRKPETLYDQPLRRVVDYKTLLPSTNSPFQQVGLARVHVEILLLSDECRQSAHDAKETADDSTGETDSEESESDYGTSRAQTSDGSLETTPTTTTAAVDNTAQVQASPSAYQPVSSLRRSRVQKEDEDDENDRPRKRPRRKPQGADPPRQRFACPYQAYQPGRDCFKPSQRNPRGGCDNISRLRDHLARKHMSSYRCPRCWKHFNARDKAQAHPESNCLEKEMPSYEWFMTLDQEAEVDNCGGTQPEDTWWKLFQLLIPNRDIEDLPLLRTRYHPYYVGVSDYVDMSLLIPSMNLSNISFHDTSNGVLDQVDWSETAPVSLASPSGAFSELGNTTMTSQSFSVPIFGTTLPQPPPIPSIEGSTTDMMSLSAAPQSYDLGSTTPYDTLNISSTPASSHTMAPSSTSDASQMRRNYERLKTRASQADAENGELRETIGSTREEVRIARDLLEEVLGMDNLEGEAYERLSRVADVLGGVVRRLR